MKLTGRFVWIGVLVVLGLLFLAPGAQASDWVTKKNMITARGYAGVAVVNGQLMVAGGLRFPAGAPVALLTPRLEAYSPWSDTWTTLRSLPAAGKVWSCGAAGLNHRLYIIGGYTVLGTTMTDKLQIYNPFTNTWRNGPVLPAPCAPFNMAAVVNNKIYVLVKDAGGKKKFYIFDPAGAMGAGSWATSTVLSVLDFRDDSTLQAIDKKLYVLGGYDSATNTRYQDVEVYDTDTNTWSTKASMPTARGLLASGALSGRLYAIGGNAFPNKVEVYNPASDTWSDGADLTYAHTAFGAAAINGTLYAAGGIDGSNFNRRLESYTPVTVNVSILTPYWGAAVGVEGPVGVVSKWAVILRLIYQTSNFAETGVVPGISIGGSASIPGLVVLLPTADAPLPGKNWADQFNVTAVNSIGVNHIEVLAVWYVDSTDGFELGSAVDATLYAAVTEGAAPAFVTDANGDGLFTDDLNALWLASNVAQVDFTINSCAEYLMKKKKK